MEARPPWPQPVVLHYSLIIAIIVNNIAVFYTDKNKIQEEWASANPGSQRKTIVYSSSWVMDGSSQNTLFIASIKLPLILCCHDVSWFQLPSATRANPFDSLFANISWGNLNASIFRGRWFNRSMTKAVSFLLIMEVSFRRITAILQRETSSCNNA